MVSLSLSQLALAQGGISGGTGGTSGRRLRAYVEPRTIALRQTYPTEFTKDWVPIYDVSSDACEAVFASSMNNNDSLSLSISCRRARTLVPGSELTYTGRTVSLIARDHTIWGLTSKGYYAYEVNFRSPDGQMGTGFIRPVEVRHLSGASEQVRAERGAENQLKRVALDLF